jgi:anaerobic ribonucleoside-triphosphate reductase activating protein
VSGVLRLYRFVDRTRAEGPGVRACVWVQGCSIHCPGCFSAHTWDPGGGYQAGVAELAERIDSLDVEGVTFMGGEPFEQPVELAELGARVRAGGRSVMTFTGYEREALEAGDRPGWSDLLAVTDLLVDGPYDWRRPDTARPWVGSTNQRFHFLTDRYTDRVLDEHHDRVEVRLLPDGRVQVNGMAPAAALRALRRQVVG